MRRRELLRMLAVVGLAGCVSTVVREDDLAVPTVRDQTPTTLSPTTGDLPSVAGRRAPPRTEPTAAAPAQSPQPTEPVGDASSSPGDAPEGAGDEPAQTTTDQQPADDDPTTAPPDAPDDPRVVTAVGRDALGLPPTRSGGRQHTITGLAVHHTASPTAAAATAPDRFRGITRAHREQGWVDAAYHWGVDVDGNVYELRPESLAGDTNTDYDPAGWFLVVCEGNFEESAPTAAMLAGVADVLAHGATRYGVSPATLRGHRDLAATLCPGANLQARLGELEAMVEARLADGGVVLAPDDDPGSVAGIENG